MLEPAPSAPGRRCSQTPFRNGRIMHYTQTSLARLNRASAYGTSLSLLLIIVVANGVLTAIPAHPLDVAALTAGADLIVVGEVTTVVEEGLTTLSLPGGSASATLFKCSLRVDRVLKGELAAESLSFEFAVPRDLVGLGTVRLGQYGMFFLKTTDRDWEFFDAKHPALPAIWNAARPTGIPLQDVT